MIQIEKMKDGFVDELFGDCTVRHFATVRALGWLSAIHTTPAGADFADILNLDIVLTSLPPWLCGKQFYFEYKNGDRIARHDGPFIGQFRHVHLQVNEFEEATLKAFLYKKIEIKGNEIALSRPGGGSFFLVDNRSTGWMGIDQKDFLNIEISAALIRNQKLRHTACHSIKPDSIQKVKFFYNGSNSKGAIKMGNQMSGNFGVAAAGASGFMSQTAKKSMAKARDMGKLKKNSKDDGEQSTEKARTQKNKE